MRHSAWIIALLVSALSACQSAPPPPYAVLELSGQPCETSPDRTTAIDLTPEKAKAFFLEVYDVTADTPCLETQDTKGKYLLFALPDEAPNHVISIGGMKQVHRILAASVSILDANGETVRTFPKTAYIHTGGMYGVQFRPRAGESFILIETDAEKVGDKQEMNETKLLSHSNTYFTATYSATYNTYSGADTKASRTFSYEGKVGVRVQALSGKIGQPE